MLLQTIRYGRKRLLFLALCYAACILPLSGNNPPGVTIRDTSESPQLIAESQIALPGAVWRSSLYPANWYPGYADSEGRFLHDFSYAGYHQGEDPLPDNWYNLVNVTEPPYNADNSGVTDVTAILQQALDDVGEAGGGIVFLPPGTYKVGVSRGTSYDNAALHMKYDSVVLRGAGPDSTFLYHAENVMRQKDLIHVRKSWSNWFDDGAVSSFLRADLVHPSRYIPVNSVSGFNVGDLVVIRNRATNAFNADHKMEGIWTENAVKGVAFLRRIDSIDVDRKLVVVDAPTRYPLKTRDFAKVTTAREHIMECGIENLSIGNLDNPKSGWGEEDYSTDGNGAYDVHYSHMVHFKYAQDCWVKNVHTYRPPENTEDIHLLSNMLLLSMCRNITVDSCSFQKPQYEGGGGNGYMYTLSGNDCMISNSHANHSRHNYDFKYPFSNGNVILNCVGENSKYSSDFHMYLSMANLIDGFTVNADYLESTFRPWGGSAIHGYSSTQSVFWNTYGEAYHSNKNYIVESNQFGWGYVIGTSGEADGVKLDPFSGSRGGYSYDASPRDFAEGVGIGSQLEPASLYLDQLSRRLEKNQNPGETNTVTFEVRDANTGLVLEGCTVAYDEVILQTDSEGRCTFSGVPSFVLLNVTIEHYQPLLNQHWMFYGDTTVELELEPVRYDLFFFVKDEATDLAIPDATLTVGDESGITDDFGKAQFEVVRGEYAYNLDKEGYIPVSGSVIVPDEDYLNLEMARDPTGIKIRSQDESIGFWVWPNPAGEMLHGEFKITDQENFVKIYSGTGQLMDAFKGVSEFNLDLSAYTEGIYLLQFLSDETSGYLQFIKR